MSGRDKRLSVALWGLFIIFVEQFLVTVESFARFVVILCSVLEEDYAIREFDDGVLVILGVKCLDIFVDRPYVSPFVMGFYEADVEILIIRPAEPLLT